MGNESCCLCDAEATAGDVIAKKESRRPAVTLPAEWHFPGGCLCAGIFKE
jgi:hypothetical protein